MGKSERIYKLSETDIENIRRMTAEQCIGIMEEKRKEIEKSVKDKKDNVKNELSYDVRKLLQNYKKIKSSAEDLVTEEEVDETRFEFMKDLMKPGELKAVMKMESEVARIAINRFYVRKLERALEAYREDAEMLGKDLRKYRVVKALYIDDVTKSEEEVAEIEFVDVRTVKRDVNSVCTDLSIYMFGIEAVFRNL